jgi:hypothetical protein
MADEPAGPIRRRRRRKATRAQGAPEPAAHTAPEPERTAAAPRRRRVPRDGGERGLRDLVGAGHSQVGVSGALRARDANRPTDDDLAEAEQNLVIVRRNWRPDEPKAGQ